MKHQTFETEFSHMSVVRMAMVNIRIVRVRVDERLMPMTMAVRLARRIIRRVFVLMMLVVHVSMCMLHLLVNVLVLVALGEMKPHARGHACGADRKRNSRPLS